MYSVIMSSPLFRGLSPKEINLLLEKVSHQYIRFRKGEMLAQTGDEIDKAIILLEGKLQGEMIDFSGNALKIEVLEPPHMIAAAFLFGVSTRFPVNLSAITDGTMLIIRKPAFILMLGQESRVMVNYLNIISGRAQFLTNKISFLALKTIREKIAFYLLQKVQSKNQKIIKIEQSQTNLADLFGVTRPSLSRTILELEKSGILNWTREEVTIVDYHKLAKILGN